MARALIVLAVLFAVVARAQEENDSWCEVMKGDDGKPYVIADGEGQKKCSARLCVGTYWHNMGFDHGATCLYAADTAGTPTDSKTLAVDFNGRVAFRLLPDDTIELVMGSSDGASQRHYRVDEHGKLVLLKAPAPPRKAAAARPVPNEDGHCSMLRDQPIECTGTAPAESVRQAAAKACQKPPEQEVFGVCSKAGCMGIVRADERDEPPCITWTGKGRAPQVLPFVDGEPVSVSLMGTELCMTGSGGCPTGCDNTACADVSGPQPRWQVGMPPPAVHGKGIYEVLKFSGAPPQLNGKADEPEWSKGATLWMNTLLEVREGLNDWRGPEDASAEWIFRWTEGALLVLVRIHDDHVMAGDTLASNDALGLGPAVLTLAPKGKVQVSGVPHATCAWAEAPGGYRMECSIPWTDLQLAAPTARWNDLELKLMDWDGGSAPLKRLEGTLQGRAWKAYPPPWDEALKFMETPW
ncbi:MAG: hypothetical protein ACJ8AT_10530 [Hyalangium sp.]|uniref:hypothetical protein n=1 Tax=Hyalangium sp. TaxID=2028555 RepID=UPI00389A3C4F